MLNLKTLIRNAFPLFFLFGCAGHMAELNEREEYSVCFSSEGGAKDFREYLISLAREEGMDVFDRGEEAQRELQSLEHGHAVLDSTTGPLILMTIEKKSMLRISITNAGLGNDLNLTFRYRSKPRPHEASTVFHFANQEYRVMPIGGNGSGEFSCENS